MSYPDRAGAGGMGMMMNMAGNGETFPIMQLRAGHLEGDAPQLPRLLADVPNWDPAKVDGTRSFVLEMGMGMMGGAMTINGRSMDMKRIDERVPLGATEIWTIRNASPIAHPFHIHDIQFRILDRNGAPAGPHERGLKDTVLVDPGESVRVITQFADFADASRPYIYHCHILEHEDAGLVCDSLKPIYPSYPRA